MYYQIQGKISKIHQKDVNPEILTVGIISLEELEACYAKFGFSNLTLTECKGDGRQIHGPLNTYNDYLFGTITGLNPDRIIQVQDRIAIYIKKNLLLIAVIEDRDDSTRRKLLDLMKHLNLSKISLERLISGFLELFINEDYVLLLGIEKEIGEHEEKINEGRLEKNFQREITDIRKRLILLYNYYQQFTAVGEELEENSADLFTGDALHFFHIFSDRARRLSDNTRMLQEYCVQVREAYQAQLEYNLNKTMTIFTVITAVFLPLTLIVGWYGMNFTTMPELTWKYGYLYVIVLSTVIAVLCLLLFKKKKLL